VRQEQPVRRDGLWGNGDFLRMWSASTVSVFGSLITRTALPFAAILGFGATPSQVGWLRIAELLPGFLIALLAGAWLDRRRRRPVMIAADLLRAGILATIPLAALLGALTLPHLLAVAAAMSVLDMAFDVGWQSYLPTVVGRDRLVEANSKVSAAGSVAEASSFSLGGWLVQWLTAPFAIAVDAVTFLASALLLRGIRTPEAEPGAGAAEREEPEGSLLAEAADGLRVVVRDPVLRALAVANLGLAASFGAGMAAFLIYVNQVLGFDPGTLGLIFAMGGVTSLAGALLAGRLGAIPLGPLMIACFVVATAGTALVPLATTGGAVGVALLVAQQFLTDPAWTVYDITQVSLRQGMTPDDLQGRVNATMRVGDVGGQILGTLAGGLVGDAFGPRAALWAGVAALAAATLWLALSPVRSLRRMPTHVLETAR